MQYQTQELIDNLKKCTSKNEVITMVEKEQQRLKALLKQQNIEFYPEDHTFPQDIADGQSTFGEDNVRNSKSYEEVNYIRMGLLYGWMTDASEQERFNPLRDSVEEIIDNFG
jgi:hypothetical protein